MCAHRCVHSCVILVAVCARVPQPRAWCVPPCGVGHRPPCLSGLAPRWAGGDSACGPAPLHGRETGAEAPAEPGAVIPSKEHAIPSATRGRPRREAAGLRGRLAVCAASARLGAVPLGAWALAASNEGTGDPVPRWGPRGLSGRPDPHAGPGLGDCDRPGQGWQGATVVVFNADGYIRKAC